MALGWVAAGIDPMLASRIAGKMPQPWAGRAKWSVLPSAKTSQIQEHIYLEQTALETHRCLGSLIVNCCELN